jgi:hypothetical protein
VGNLQSREIRELLGGTAEDLREPSDSLLVRHVQEGPVAKDIRQAVWAGVRLPGRHLLRRPKVPPPRHKRQRKENREGSGSKNSCQSFSLHVREVQTPRSQWPLEPRLKTSNLSDGWAWQKAFA